jgi:tape measure domain-containing protein
MTDLATLGLEIRSDGVVVAKDRLRDFEGQANRTSKATDMLLKAFGALAAVFSVTKLIQYTNTWTDLNSRIEIATGSIGRGAATMDRLDQMARRTYSSLELTAESFLRNATSMRDLGYSTNQTLDYVEAINNALVVSGTKGERAESVMNALGKAMALGKLSGDELNTVIGSGGRIAQALADSLGVTTLELRKMGTEGKLTGDVIYQGLTSQLETLREEADSMPATIGDAFVLLNNSILAAVGRFDEMSGASSRVAEAIIWVADAIGDGTISIERLLSIAVAMGAYMAGAWVVSFVAANGAVGALTAGLTLLRGALIRTGIGALIVLAGELVYQLWNVVDGAGSIEDAFGRLKKSGVDTWERIVSGGEAMYHSMEYWALEIASLYMMTWTKIQNGFFDMLAQLSAATGVALPGMEAWEASIIRGFDQATALHTAALAAKDAAKEALGAMFADKSTATGDLGSMPSFGEMGDSFGAGGAGGGRGAGGGTNAKADAYDRLTKSIRENIAEMKVEAETLGLTEYQTTKLTIAQDLLRAAAEAKRPITTELTAEINAMAQSYADAELAVEGARLELENLSPWEQMGLELQKLDEMLAQGAIGWNTYASAVSKAVGVGLGSLTSMASEAAGLLGQMFEDSKEVAIAQAVLSGAEGVARTLGAYPFPFNIALAGLHAAAAAGQVAAIMSTSKSSTSTARAPSGGSMPSQPSMGQQRQTEKSPERMDITLHGLDRGTFYSGENVESLLRAIEERAADGRILNIKVA